VLAHEGNLLKLVINGQARKQEYFIEDNMVHVFNQAGDQLGFRFESDERTAADQEVSRDTFCKSPMPGTITKIYKQKGDILKKGEAILAEEAMKMELVIRAPFDCKIVKIFVV
jgi:biotin carboxyl carrier protein